MFAGLDPLLKPYRRAIQRRHQAAVLRMLDFTDGKCPLNEVFNSHLYYGLHKTDRGWIFREKAPAAKQLFLMGEFSYWEVNAAYELHPVGQGDWEIELPSNMLKHGMLYKLWMVWQDGADERLPSCVTRVVQDEQTKIFSAQVWDPPVPYKFVKEQPSKPEHPLIYEAHIGMSSQEEKISTYWEFGEYILPRIKSLGYNTIQLMAIQEHPYYGSFGYQVSNLFAPSSRFGTPDELKEMIDKAHAMGISVILDVVHSHAVMNEKEGLSRFDGSETLYFHGGERGLHPVWKSRCFNYGKAETISLLLSNLKYWLQEFRFDGFRFDGVTSMCYLNHGIGVDFLKYAQYFDDNVDEDAITYLTLANSLIKEVNPNALTIAEDVSGMPGMACPIEQEGIGFDYRMSMGIADYWTKLLKKVPDENWGVGDIFFKLTDHRVEEHTISYAESHDQAMVGDKTLIFRMIDKDMYTSMSMDAHNLTVDRGVAIHKLIRLLTLSLSDGGYLNFMGNEFGHPEWIDFPRQGNDWSLKYARRQWNLVDDKDLKYCALNLFDKEMIHLIEEYDVLSEQAIPIVRNEGDQVLVFERNDCLFVFNLNPEKSFVDYEISCDSDEYKIVLNSDNPKFAGFGRVNEDMTYPASLYENGRKLKLYLPARTAIVLAPVN